MKAKKLFPGVFVMTNLMALAAACGGYEKASRMQEDTPAAPAALIAGGTCDPDEVIQTTAAGLVVFCDTTTWLGCYPDGTFAGCTTTSSVLYPYQNNGTTNTVLLRPQYLHFRQDNGNMDTLAKIDGSQMIYIGPGNGFLSLSSGTVVSFYTNESAESAYKIWLPQDMCLWKTSTTKVLCKGDGNYTQFNQQGYVYLCPGYTPCTN